MSRTNIEINKLLYLGLSILNINKIVMHEFVMYEYWYNYVKTNYRKRAELWYTNRDSFIVHVKSEDIYADVPRDIKKRTDASNNESKDRRVDERVIRWKNNKRTGST